MTREKILLHRVVLVVAVAFAASLVASTFLFQHLPDTAKPPKALNYT